MSGPMGALGGAWPMIIDDVSVKRDHISKNVRETRMHNIFWIIGVIVVVIAVLSFLGLR
jgi:ABC-type dipeptide/oligopeptide/nickel transport system permease subunit